MLGREAGVSQGLIYAHFSSKGALLDAIIDQQLSAVETSFGAAQNACDSADRIERLTHACFVVLRERLDFWRIAYALRLQSPDLPELGDLISEWTDALRLVIVDNLRRAGSVVPEVEANILLATLDGISEHYALEPQHYTLDAVKRRLVELYRAHGPGPTPVVTTRTPLRQRLADLENAQVRPG
jgi:AcrR family transcriptional regulator